MEVVLSFYMCIFFNPSSVLLNILLSPRPLQVSLDSRVREVINRNMLEPTSHTFDDAQQQIYTLMQRDSYPRFINSSAYADLLKSLEESQSPSEP